MTQTPGPLNGKSLTRASVAGFGLATLGILLFVILWVVLGQAGFQPAARLIAALCIPPAVIALILGIYVLFVRPNRKND